MISLHEQKSFFSDINRELHQKIKIFIAQLKSSGLTFSPMTTQTAQAEGFAPEQLYYIKSGTVAVDYEDRCLYLYEAGDIFIPHCVNQYEQTEISFTVKSELEIEVLSLNSLNQTISSIPELLPQWMSILQLIQLQTNQIAGALTPVKDQATPGFQRFTAGEVIINEGALPDYVYSVTSGSATAIHNDIEVGVINQGEIFGAIAVLTGQRRTASVVAKTNCSVLMVHKDDFSKMVHTHPELFLNILKDLSNTVKSLNKRISDNDAS